MFRSFDAYGKFETPQLMLCNPSGKELKIMSHAKKINATLRIGGYSELSFEVAKFVNGNLVKYYDLIQKLRLVKVENYGVFVIDDIKEFRDGITTSKSVSCKSIDALFATKSLVNVEGTYKLYDILDSESMMSMIFAKMPDWRIGEFDGDLMNTYRTYSLSEQNLYDLMMNDLSEDFQCVFTFDTFNKLINIKTTQNQIKKTDIFVSFENLLKDIEISTVTDSIKTSLEVYGADGLSIHEVNPLGGTIYKFDYFKTTEWLSQETINAINLWETKVETNRITFANYLTQISDLNTTLIGYKIQLTDLEGELKALENVLSAQVSQGISTIDTLNSISNKNTEIENKKSQITQTENHIDFLKETNDAIQDDLKPSNNFTESQLLELMSISNTTGGVYTNDAFVKTSSMSNIEIQEEAQRLYDLALTVLDKESQPRYTFTANIINFLALEWAEKFSNQLELGCEFTVGIDEDTFFYPVLLEYSIPFDDIKSCTMTFSNNLRLTNDQFDFASLFDGVKSTVSSVSTSKGLWEDYIKSGDKDSLFSLKNDALDLATKTIKSTSGQDFIIDQTGIRGRKLLEGDIISPNQLWMANNGIYMTTDGWESSDLAVGEITFNGIKKYGIATEILIGNLIAGESLVIKNQNNTVTIDALGLNATNASITLNSSSGKNQILLNPNDAIRIKSKVNGVFEDKFYVDTEGELNLKGRLIGATGTFSGDLTASNLIGGTIILGDGKFKVDVLGNCEASSLKLTGGSINVNNQFTVDEYGNAVTNNLTVNGGTLNLANLVMTGKISFGNLPSGIASTSDIPTESSIQSIASTTITDTLVSSPRIEGAEIIGGALRQKSIETKYGNCEIENGKVGFWTKNSSGNNDEYLGEVSGDNTNKQLWLTATKALKLESVIGDISLSPRGGGGNIYLEGKVVVTGGTIVDEKGNSIGGGGVAVFG